MQTCPTRPSAAPTRLDPASTHGLRRHLPGVAVAFGALVVALNLIVATRLGAGH